MAQVNPENSTSVPAVSTRRSFLSGAAGVAAGSAVVALATIPPVAVASAPGPSALAMDGTKISQELRDLVHALQDADETLIAAHAAHDAECVLYRDWVNRTPEPTSNSRRAHRRWDGRQKAYMRGSNFYATQDAHLDACEVHRAARKAIAEYRARDMNELAHKACAACVFEGGADDKPRGYMRPFMAMGVAIDLARMSVGGGMV